MAKLQQTVEINAPSEQVYSYLLDFRRHSEWAYHPLQVNLEEGAEVTAGSKFTSSAQMMGSHEANIEIIELVPNQKIVFEAEDDTGRFRHEYQIATAGNGSVLTKSVEQTQASFKNKLLFSLLGPLLGRKISKQDAAKIKANIEGQAS